MLYTMCCNGVKWPAYQVISALIVFSSHCQPPLTHHTHRTLHQYSLPFPSNDFVTSFSDFIEFRFFSRISNSFHDRNSFNIPRHSNSLPLVCVPFHIPIPNHGPPSPRYDYNSVIFPKTELGCPFQMVWIPTITTIRTQVM